MTAAFVFPGQGAQHAGLLHQLPPHAEVARTLAEATSVLGFDLLALDTGGSLRSTAIVQQALLVAGVATARALTAERVRVAMVGGMSLGAFSAATACGTLAFADALRIVHLRGELMEAAYPVGYGLAAIEGLDEDRVGTIVDAIRTTALPVYISNINAPRQIVVAGIAAALDATAAEARRQGGRAQRLAVPVPSHSPLMQHVADRLREALAPIRLRPPAVPYLSNRGGRALYDAEAIREDLATSVAHPVRWYDALEVMRELGATVFVEMPPGHVSTHLVASLFSDVTAISIADRGLHAAALIAGVAPAG